MKDFTEQLIICGDYRAPTVYDNPDVLIDAYQQDLTGRHCNHVRIFTERQKELTSYEYDFVFRANNEEDFFDGLIANAEWFTFDSLRFASDDLRALSKQGVIYERQEVDMIQSLQERAA
jgi:hypothetical protein